MVTSVKTNPKPNLKMGSKVVDPETTRLAELSGGELTTIISHPAVAIGYHRSLQTEAEIRAALGKIGREWFKQAERTEGTLFAQTVRPFADYLDLKACETRSGGWVDAVTAKVNIDNAKAFLREAMGYTREIARTNRWRTIDNVIGLVIQAGVLIQMGWVGHQKHPAVPGEPFKLSWVSSITRVAIEDAVVEQERKAGRAFLAVTGIGCNFEPMQWSAKDRAYRKNGEDRRVMVPEKNIRAQYKTATVGTTLTESGDIPKAAAETAAVDLASLLKSGIDKLATDQRLQLLEAAQMILEDFDTLRSFHAIGMKEGQKAGDVVHNLWATVQHTFNTAGFIRPLADLEASLEGAEEPTA